MQRFEPQYRMLGPEDFRHRPPPPPPEAERRTCALCMAEETIQGWDGRFDPFICRHCEARAWEAVGVRIPPHSDDIWASGFGRHYKRALAAWRAISSELLNIAYQKHTGKMGDHPAWRRMTREARAAYAEQPAPPRAFMP